MHPNGDGEALWRARVGKVLKGEPFETLVTRTADGIEIGPLYAAVEAANPALRQEPDRPWRIVQRVDHPEPDTANELALADLAGGADGLALVMSGSPASRGFGLSPSGLSTALEGVELDLVVLELDPAPGDDEATAMALLRLVAARRLVPEALDIDFGLDPLGAVAATGRDGPGFAQGLGPLVDRLRGEGFAGPFLRADTRRHHEAGATPGEELGVALATGIAYLRDLEGIGIAPAEGRKLVSFRMAADADQFQTLAKFRALRRLWAAVERACGLEPEPTRLLAETSFRMMTRRDPAVNWLRTTSALLAAGTGGADRIVVAPHAAALGLPDGFSRRMARNQQLILLGESGLGHVGDPGGGSGAVEALTAALAARGWAVMQELEIVGGLAGALRSGTWQARLAASRQRRAADLAEKRTVLVGVTAFLDRTGRETAVLRPAPPDEIATSTDLEPLPSVRDEDLAPVTEDAA